MKKPEFILVERGRRFTMLRWPILMTTWVNKFSRVKNPEKWQAFNINQKKMHEDGFTVNTLADWQYLHSFSDKIKREGEGDDQWGHRRTLYNQF